MASRTKPPTRSIAVLKLPDANAPLFLARARFIHDAMTGNASFPSPRPTLASIAAAIDAMSEAQVATYSRTTGTTAVRDARRAALRTLLEQLRSYVQAVADDDPENAASTIESAGMSVKKAKSTRARVFTVKRGRTSGSVTVLAPRAGDRASYEFARSLDGGKTWEPFATLNKSTAVLEGLTPGSTVHFRYRVTVHNVTHDWSDVFAYLVL